MNRRELIKHIGIGLCAGAIVPFFPSLIPDIIGADVSSNAGLKEFNLPDCARFEVGQYVSYASADSDDKTVYVTSIDYDRKIITLREGRWA